METCYVKSKGKKNSKTKAKTENYTFTRGVFCDVSPAQSLQPKKSKGAVTAKKRLTIKQTTKLGRAIVKACVWKNKRCLAQQGCPLYLLWCTDYSINSSTSILTLIEAHRWD